MNKRRVQQQRCGGGAVARVAFCDITNVRRRDDNKENVPPAAPPSSRSCDVDDNAPHDTQWPHSDGTAATTATATSCACMHTPPRRDDADASSLLSPHVTTTTTTSNTTTLATADTSSSSLSSAHTTPCHRTPGHRVAHDTYTAMASPPSFAAHTTSAMTASAHDGSDAAAVTRQQEQQQQQQRRRQRAHERRQSPPRHAQLHGCALAALLASPYSALQRTPPPLRDVTASAATHNDDVVNDKQHDSLAHVQAVMAASVDDSHRANDSSNDHDNNSARGHCCTRADAAAAAAHTSPPDVPRTVEEILRSCGVVTALTTTTGSDNTTTKTTTPSMAASDLDAAATAPSLSCAYRHYYRHHSRDHNTNDDDDDDRQAFALLAHSCDATPRTAALTAAVADVSAEMQRIPYDVLQQLRDDDDDDVHGVQTRCVASSHTPQQQQPQQQQRRLSPSASPSPLQPWLRQSLSSSSTSSTSTHTRRYSPPRAQSTSTVRCALPTNTTTTATTTTMTSHNSSTRAACTTATTATTAAATARPSSSAAASARRGGYYTSHVRAAAGSLIAVAGRRVPVDTLHLLRGGCRSNSSRASSRRDRHAAADVAGGDADERNGDDVDDDTDDGSDDDDDDDDSMVTRPSARRLPSAVVHTYTTPMVSLTSTASLPSSSSFAAVKPSVTRTSNSNSNGWRVSASSTRCRGEQNDDTSTYGRSSGGGGVIDLDEATSRGVLPVTTRPALRSRAYMPPPPSSSPQQEQQYGGMSGAVWSLWLQQQQQQLPAWTRAARHDATAGNDDDDNSRRVPSLRPLPSSDVHANIVTTNTQPATTTTTTTPSSAIVTRCAHDVVVTLQLASGCVVRCLCHVMHASLSSSSTTATAVMDACPRGLPSVSMLQTGQSYLVAIAQTSCAVACTADADAADAADVYEDMGQCVRVCDVADDGVTATDYDHCCVWWQRCNQLQQQQHVHTCARGDSVHAHEGDDCTHTDEHDQGSRCRARSSSPSRLSFAATLHGVVVRSVDVLHSAHDAAQYRCVLQQQAMVFAACEQHFRHATLLSSATLSVEAVHVSFDLRVCMVCYGCRLRHDTCIDYATTTTTNATMTMTTQQQQHVDDGHDASVIAAQLQQQLQHALQCRVHMLRVK